LRFLQRRQVRDFIEKILAGTSSFARTAGGWPRRNASSLVEPVGIPDLLRDGDVKILSRFNVDLFELPVPGKWQSGLL
jgi:hypothetical protein